MTRPGGDREGAETGQGDGPGVPGQSWGLVWAGREAPPSAPQTGTASPCSALGPRPALQWNTRPGPGRTPCDPQAPGRFGVRITRPGYRPARGRRAGEGQGAGSPSGRRAALAHGWGQGGQGHLPALCASLRRFPPPKVPSRSPQHPSYPPTCLFPTRGRHRSQPQEAQLSGRGFCRKGHTGGGVRRLCRPRLQQRAGWKTP